MWCCRRWQYSEDHFCQKEVHQCCLAETQLSDHYHLNTVTHATDVTHVTDLTARYSGAFSTDWTSSLIVWVSVMIWHHVKRTHVRPQCLLVWGQLTLWHPLLPYGWYTYKASCARPGKAIICNFWHPGTLTLSPERESAGMSKITNDCLTQSGTGCFMAVPILRQWTSKG